MYDNTNIDDSMELKRAARSEQRKLSGTTQGSVITMQNSSTSNNTAVLNSGRRKKRKRSTGSQAGSLQAISSHHGSGSVSHQHRGSRAGRIDPEDDDKEGGERRRMALVISVFAAGLFLTAVLLIAITLRMTPAIDERSGLMVPNRHSISIPSTPRRSCTPTDIEPWVLILRKKSEQRRLSILQHENNAELKRKYVVGIFATFAAMLLGLAILMITVTLRISPEIDKIDG